MVLIPMKISSPVFCRAALTLLVCSLPLIAVCPALAQSQTEAVLKEVVVTASRNEQLLSSTLPNTSVITRQDIERSQAVDLVTLQQRDQINGLGALDVLARDHTGVGQGRAEQLLIAAGRHNHLLEHRFSLTLRQRRTDGDQRQRTNQQCQRCTTKYRRRNFHRDKNHQQMPSPSSPTAPERHGFTPGVQPPCWPVSGLVDATSIAFPSACSKR